MKRFEVTLFYHTNITVVVDAEDEYDAIEKAHDEACDEKYNDEFNMNAQEDGTPYVQEVEE